MIKAKIFFFYCGFLIDGKFEVCLILLINLIIPRTLFDKWKTKAINPLL